jgi:hypothetical protein
MVIWLCSGRLLDAMVSMPAIPAIDASRIWVTWLSMISALAPGYSVVTLTTGWSILGYSRTVNVP